MVDCDLSNCSGEIPHAELMRSVARRVSDGRMLGLVKAWLEMQVEEGDGKHSANRAHRGREATSQGAPISTLLSERSDKTGILTVMGTCFLPISLKVNDPSSAFSHECWRAQVAAGIAGNSSCTSLNMPLRRLGRRHLSSESSLSVRSACRNISVV